MDTILLPYRYDFIEKARANNWCEFEAYVPWSEGMREKLVFTLAQ